MWGVVVRWLPLFRFALANCPTGDGDIQAPPLARQYGILCSSSTEGLWVIDTCSLVAANVVVASRPVYIACLQKKEGLQEGREMMGICSRQGTKRKLETMNKEMSKLQTENKGLQHECQTLKARLEAIEKSQKAKNEEVAKLKNTVEQELKTLSDKLTTMGKLANKHETPLFDELKSHFRSLHTQCLDALSSFSPSSTSSLRPRLN
ncbi:hypothetical protein GOP47_0018706 [Adiantum capillus-veneris]|uniref:Uncharacterized protein n=1 Tax=Adiantum capillus-veneris TaxID=13818 RepID=A0A9D4Z9W2_ADICA|nr:hypothetical protein GOP47_0018706 [Adiantum capillus-veneris]